MKGQPLQLRWADLQGPFCSTVCFSATVNVLSQSSSYLKNVKDGNLRVLEFHDLLGGVGHVSFASRRGNFMED